MLSYKTLKKVYSFNHSNCSHSSLEVVVYLFLSLKWWQSFILWIILCRIHSLYHCSHPLSLISIRCHSLSLVVTLYHSLHHSMSFVVTRCTTRCQSLYHSLSLVVIRCHSLSLDVPLVCLFINDPLKVLKLLVFVLFSFCIISNIMVI